MKNKKGFHFKKNIGQSLLEVVFATTVVSLVMTSIAATMTMSLKSAANSKYQGFANYFSQESQEFFKRERVKLGWTEFKEIISDAGASVCLNSTPDDLEDILGFNSICTEGYGFTELNNDFYRNVSFEFPEEDVIVVITTVTWYDGSREKTSELRTVFTDQTSALTGIMPTPLPGLTPVSIAGATASNTYSGYPTSNVYDGDENTGWNSGGFATQWIELDLGQIRQISKIDLLVGQYPDGNTIHTVYAGPNSNPTSQVAQFSGYTSTWQLLSKTFYLNLENIRYVRIVTTQSPSWVAWLEIKVFSYD